MSLKLLHGTDRRTIAVLQMGSSETDVPLQPNTRPAWEARDPARWMDSTESSPRWNTTAHRHTSSPSNLRNVLQHKPSARGFNFTPFEGI